MPTDSTDWSKIDLEQRLGNQIKVWNSGEITVDKKPFLTISREYGAEGWTLGEKIEQMLNKEHSYDPPWLSYNKGIIEKLEKNENLSQKLVDSLERPAQDAITDFFNSYFAEKPPRIAIFKKTARIIKTLASQGHVILVGRGGCFITNTMPKGFHVRCVANMEWKIKNISNQQNLSHDEAKKLIERMDHERDAFIKDYFFTDVSDSHYYDLVINTSKMSLEAAAELVIFGMKRKGLI